ncbi:MAG: glycosyltransferase family 2 protein [Deltaproteobacteria bacterium]|nr:glycosyltransferase family 2 protein [Deltaproteobacteria bacterium]
MLNIVIPMAGRGSRFASVGFRQPKPLIQVYGKSMIDIVVNNLTPECPHCFIFICLREHQEQYGLQEHLSALAPGCKIIYVDKVTEGAACTVLLARDLINNNDPLMIANSDQWIDVDINEYLKKMEMSNVAGLIMTMWADDPKWSFVRLNAAGRVLEVVEKEVVSNEATVGIYNYRYGSDYVISAENMIAKNLRVNNEFYVAPVYNEMLEAGQFIDFYNIGKINSGMYGLGTPEDLEFFMAMPVSEKATTF